MKEREREREREREIVIHVFFFHERGNLSKCNTYLYTCVDYKFSFLIKVHEFHESCLLSHCSSFNDYPGDGKTTMA